MSYRFDPGEAAERGLKRMVREQIDRAITEIDTQNLSYHERIHQLRKRCKKIRALARLARASLGDQYRAINAYYRDVARPFSDLRDAHALVESFGDVMDDHTDEIDADAFTPVRAALLARRDAISAGVDIGAMLVAARDAFHEGRELVDTWHVDANGFDALAGGVHRVYERGRKAMGKAHDDPSPAQWHEWRKRAKYLWYHLRVLRPLWPGPLTALRDEADRLAGLLGDDHDTHVFQALAREDRELVGLDATPAYLDLLNRRSDMLRAEASRLGRRVYAEKPKRFVARLAAYDAAGPVLA